MSDKPISSFKPASNIEYFLFATIFFELPIFCQNISVIGTIYVKVKNLSL